MNQIEETLKEIGTITDVGVLSDKALALLICDWMIKQNNAEFGANVKFKTGVFHINVTFEES